MTGVNVIIEFFFVRGS